MSDTRMLKILRELDARKVVIIKPSALGDVVQSLPLLPVLQQRFPNATIDWVIRSELAGLLEGHPRLNRVLHYYRRGGWKESFQLLKQLSSAQYDLALDLQGLLRTGVMTAATRARVRVGMQTSRECSHLACHGLIPGTEKTVPAHARYWKIAEVLGADGPPAPIELGITDQERTKVDELLETIHRPFLAIHPGAMWVTKRWPAASFAKIAARSCTELGCDLVVIGTQKEAAEAQLICDAVSQSCPDAAVLNVAGKTSLKELAVLLQRAHVVLSNDSGPMHLAAGVGSRVVGIFTCTSSERSGPPGEHHRLIQAKVPCAASYRKQCPYSGSGHMQCLSAVSVHQVLTNLRHAWKAEAQADAA